MQPQETLSSLYNRNTPFFARIKERKLLSHPHSLKKTYHIVIDLEGSGLTYKVGDCIAVYPYNHIQLVDNLLARFIDQPEEIERKGEFFPLKYFLSAKANLNRINRSLLQLLFEIETSNDKKTFLQSLLDPHSKEQLKNYIESKSLSTLFRDFPDVKFPAKEFCETLSPLLPRFYSIASSMNHVGREAHLTIRLTEYEQDFFLHRGVCSSFLCESVNLNESYIPIYLQQADHFYLPEDSFDKPMIMIGPGTGIAPFRGFMQERALKGAHKNWIFFGERHRAYDFYYEDEWNFFISQNQLRLDTAFSRDQDKKIYVQDRLIENGCDVWQWIESGGYVYICGDASKMARDVENSLLSIFQTFGKQSTDEAKNFLKHLRKTHRLQKDVY